MFRRALREPRVVIGVILIVAAALGGWSKVRRAKVQADNDFALCGRAGPAPGCVTRRLPVSVGWTESSSNGFHRTYELTVRTSRRSSYSMSDLPQEAVRPFEGVSSADTRFRDGRLAAVLAPDGTALEVPFAFTSRVFVAFGLVAAAFLAGGGLLAWGFTRVNRTPAQDS